VIVQVKDLKEGDQFFRSDGGLAWTATSDARVLDDSNAVEIDVVWPDGGNGLRHWLLDDFELPVTRTRGNASPSDSQ
jgi:hypothetical protein